jgi:DNA-directed RNA polymerase subunit E'/Rpb7
MLFAPFHSEIIVGKVVETTSSYVRGELSSGSLSVLATADASVSLGFFKDAYIPLDLMPPNST